MSTGVINDSFQDNLVFLEKYSNSILDEIAELHINDSESINESFSHLSDQTAVKSQLSLIQSSFQDIFTVVSILKKSSSNDSNSTKNVDLNNKTVKLNDILKILKPFSQGSVYQKVKSQVNISSTNSAVIKEVELVGKLENLIILYTIVSLYQITLTQLLNNTVPLNDDLFYYGIVSSSGWRTALYSLQTLPSRGSNLVQNILDDFKRTATPDISSLNIQVPQYIVTNQPAYVNTYKLFIHYRNVLTHSLYDNILANNLKGFYKTVSKNKNFNVLDFKKSSLTVKNYFSIIIGAPFNSVSQELNNKRSRLSDLQSQNAKKLGYLITNVPNISKIHGSQNEVQQSINSLVSIFPQFSSNDITTKSDDQFVNLFNIANTIIPQSKQSIQSIRSSNGKPSFLTRYWPTLLFTGLYGPGAIITVITNKDQIIEFIQTSLIGTIKGFWNNWILKPVSNILSTIRHDDNSEISIMSQKSLDSDLDSLKRMVIEYTLENTPEYKNLRSTDLEIVKKDLDTLVSSGDLTPLMKGYENDIKEPLKNMLKGRLTRALLIQIQKTKVDGAVAISGIDKLLKSQELVFGIVAASPSLVIVVYLTRAFNSYVQKGYISRGSTERKLIISRNLNNIERLLNSTFDSNNDLDYINGMLLLEIISLRNAGVFVIPKNRRFEWVRDVNDLNDKNASPSTKLNTVQRIHNIYGHFITG